MDVSRWMTPATYFPWPHVQRHIDDIEIIVFRIAIEFAQEQFLSIAKPCPKCGCEAGRLFWFSIADPEPAWDAGTGRVGFLTLCKICHLQVDFLIDNKLTEMQANQWRECRTLS